MTRSLRITSGMMMVAALSAMTAVTSAELLVEYKFEGNTNDSSGSGLHGDLIGDAVVQEGRLFLPGGLDNSMSIPLGEYSPFGGLTNWTLTFDFQTVDEGTGSLFSADGSSQCEDDECRDIWPDGEETGDQTGSLNVFLSAEGAVHTDFWFIDLVASEGVYNDDDVHTYVGTYDAEFGEFTQTIDDEDEVLGAFVFERDTSEDRTFAGDESNGDFGSEFNPDGFNGFFDNLSIDSSGDVPDKTPTGDFNQNGVLDLPDINMLGTEIAAMTNDVTFDLNGDGNVDSTDQQIWVKDLKNTWFGDANLDGEFSSGDLVAVFTAGKFEADVDAGWEDGDWNPTRRFTTGDIVAAFTDGGYELGPRPAAAAVPEPSAIVMLGGVLLMVMYRRRTWPTS